MKRKRFGNLTSRKNVLQEVRNAAFLPSCCSKVALISLPEPWEHGRCDPTKLFFRYSWNCLRGDMQGASLPLSCLEGDLQPGAVSMRSHGGGWCWGRNCFS